MGSKCQLMVCVVSQPMLPTAAVCALCNKGETSSSSGADVDSAAETVMQTDEPQWQLMECNVCWNIVHPYCLRDAYPQLTSDGVINDDLPNSWECPKCCDAGARKNIKVSHYSERQCQVMEHLLIS